MDDVATSSDNFVPSYRYRDGQLNIIHHTSVPKDDEAAISYFHTVVRFGPAYKPKYVERVIREADKPEEYRMLRWQFDSDTMQTTKMIA